MINQNKHYQQLTQGSRYQISVLREAGMSLRAIAELVGMHFSTVSRELRKNATADGYHPEIAHQLSDIRRKAASKANKRTERTDTIIRNRWLLAGRLKQ
jgi:IS30 family transposase